MAKGKETGAGSQPGQPSGVASSEEAGGAPPGTQKKEPVAEFDFSTAPEEAWESGQWYEHVPEDAVSLDRFPQFGESGQQAKGVRNATDVGDARFHNSG